MQLDMHAQEVQSQRQMDHDFLPLTYPIVIAQDSRPHVGMLECWIIGQQTSL